MTKNVLLATLLVVVSLLVGGLIAYAAFPQEVTITKEVPKTVYVDRNITVEKVLVEQVAEPSILDKAVDEFMIAVENEDVDALNGYDFDEIEISRIYDSYSVAVDDDKTTVEFSIRLKYDEPDAPSEKVTYDVAVTFEDGEDTEVELV